MSGLRYQRQASTIRRKRWTATYTRTMLTLVIILLIIWAVLAILGFVIKSLLWLAIVGIVLFVITALIGYIRRGGRAKN